MLLLQGVVQARRECTVYHVKKLDLLSWAGAGTIPKKQEDVLKGR